jgi:hypothetical protein
VGCYTSSISPEVPPVPLQKFFCWGFLVAGPNWKASIGTALLIAAPAGVFLGLVAPYMADEVNVALLVIGCGTWIDAQR